MYATVEETEQVRASRDLARRRSAPTGSGGVVLPALEEQVCAESGVWAPDAARRAVGQSGGDLPGAVALMRVWAAALPHVTAHPVTGEDVHLVRRVSAAYPDIPGGQWLGVSPEAGSRLLDWSDADDDVRADGSRDDHVRADHGCDDVVQLPTQDATDAPSRADTPRVRELLRGVRVAPVRSDETGADPARSVLVPPFDRATRAGVLARAETASLVSLASLVLAQRREAVLLELTVAEVTVRVPHPRTGELCGVATVPVTEVEAVLDADVDARPGFAVGWGASLGTTERRAIALALLDGAGQGDGANVPVVRLDEQTVLAATDGSATTGFVDHLRLPHHASFASYLEQVVDRRHDHGIDLEEESA